MDHQSNSSQVDQENNFKTQELSHNAFLFIPAFVADNENLDDATILLFGRLNALSNRKGYCYASDDYLAHICKVKERVIQTRLSKLEQEGYIKRDTKKIGMGWDRKIYTCTNSSKIMFTSSTDEQYRVAHTNSIEQSIRATYKYKKTNNINKESISKDIPKKKTVDKSTLDSKESHICSKYLFEKLKELRPERKIPDWIKWDKQFDLMLRVDKIPKDKIIEAINFATRIDNGFKVKSPESLRNKYENIADHIVLSKKQMPKTIMINNDEDKKILTVTSLVNNWLMNETRDPIKINLGTIKLEEKRIIGPNGMWLKKSYDELMRVVRDVYKAPDGLLRVINEKCSQINSISSIGKKVI